VNFKEFELYPFKRMWGNGSVGELVARFVSRGKWGSSDWNLPS